MRGIDAREIGVGIDRRGDGISRLGLIRAWIDVVQDLGARLRHRVAEPVGAPADVGKTRRHVQDEVGAGAASQLEHRGRGRLATLVVVRLDVLELDRLAHRRVDRDGPLLGGHEPLDIGDQGVWVRR